MGHAVNNSLSKTVSSLTTLGGLLEVFVAIFHAQKGWRRLLVRGQTAVPIGHDPGFLNVLVCQGTTLDEPPVRVVAARVIHKDKAGIDLGEEVVEEPEDQRCQAAPVELGTRHTIGAHFVDPPFLLKFCHLISPIFGEDLECAVCFGEIRLQENPLLAWWWAVPPSACGAPEAPGQGDPAAPDAWAAWSQWSAWTQSRTVDAVVRSWVCLFHPRAIVDGADLVSFTMSRWVSSTKVARMDAANSSADE
eukprot:s366_g36.t1